VLNSAVSFCYTRTVVSDPAAVLLSVTGLVTLMSMMMFVIIIIIILSYCVLLFCHTFDIYYIIYVSCDIPFRLLTFRVNRLFVYTDFIKGHQLLFDMFCKHRMMECYFFPSSLAECYKMSFVSCVTAVYKRTCIVHAVNLLTLCNIIF